MAKGTALAQRLTGILDEAAPKLANVTEREASRPHAPGKWSPKQIVGHLIDSAINNHARFDRAQLNARISDERLHRAPSPPPATGAETVAGCEE